MTDVNKESAETQSEAAVEQTNTETDVKALQEKLATTEALLDKARKGETHNRNLRKDLEAKLAEFDADGLKSKYESVSSELETLKQTIKQQAIDVALSEAAKAAGAKDVKAVLRLVDRNAIELADGVADAKSIETAIAKTKTEFGVLFETPKTPDLKRPGEQAPISGFKTEMAAAKTPQAINEVLKKYGMGSTI